MKKNKTKTTNYVNKYLDNYNKSIEQGKDQIILFQKIFETLKSYKKNNKVHIFGNGGSASIASHFSMDLTNNSNIKCYNYNDPSIITCFANDFKFDHWIEKTIDKYGNKGDLLILISSSGNSKNMIFAARKAKRKKFNKVITLTGFNKNNPLKKIGDINLWINSKKYNIIESTHHMWLLMLVDMIKDIKS